MSATIDERVVELRFDNKQFETNVKDTLNTIFKLKQSVDNLEKSTSSLDSLNNIASKVDFSGISAGIQTLTDRFSTLGIIGMRVIENITDALFNKVASAVNFATNAVVTGGINRAMNIENARFQLQGLISDAEEVQKVMDQASDSVNGTAYSYDAAAKAASMFAATGLKAGDEMYIALRAIAGVAATTNSDYEGISHIFTTVAGNGRLMAEQLNSLAARGMNAAAAITKFFNEVTDGTITSADGLSEAVEKSIKSFTKGRQITESELRELVSKGKVSFEMFSQAMGITFGEHAKDANKTFTGAMSNIKAAFARTGAMFVSPMIVQEGKMVELFNAIRVKVNEMNKALAPFATLVTDKLNKEIPRLTKFVQGLSFAILDADGNLQENGDIMKVFFNILEGSKKSLQGVAEIFKTIGKIFTHVFGQFDPKIIVRLSESFVEFGEKFKMTMVDLTKVKVGYAPLVNFFHGLFEVIKLVGDGFKYLVQSLAPAKAPLKSIGNLLLDLMNRSGLAMLKFVEWARSSDKVAVASEKLADIIAFLSEKFNNFIGKLKDGLSVISEFFKSKIPDKFSEWGNSIKSMQNPLEQLWSVIKSIASTVGEIIGQVSPVITEFVSTVWTGLITALSDINPIKAFVTLLNGIFTSGMISTLTKFIKSLKASSPTTIISKINSTLSSLNTALKQFTVSIEAGALRDIATSILMLAGACLVLSTLDGEELAKSLGAVTVLLTEVSGILVVLHKLSSTSKLTGINGFLTDLKNAAVGFANANTYNTMANALIKVSAAVLILAVAMRAIAKLSWDEIQHGLIVVTMLIGELVAAGALLKKSGASTNLAAVGVGLLFVALSVTVLAKAVQKLSVLSWEEIFKGLTSVLAMLASIGVFTALVGGQKKMMSIGFGMIFLAASMLVMYKAVKSFADLDYGQITKGLVAIGGLLAEMAVFAAIASKAGKGFSSGLSVILIAAGITILASAFEKIAKLSWEGISKAIVAMGTSLIGIAAALNFIPATAILKAAGAVVLAAAFVLIGNEFLKLGSMRLEQVLSATISLAAILAGMVLALELMPATALLKAAGALVFAVAIVAVGEEFRRLSSIDFPGILNASIALAAILAGMVLALDLMPASSILKAAGAVVFAVAIVAIASAFQKLGEMELDQVLHAVIAMIAIISSLVALAILAGTIGAMAGPVALGAGVIFLLAASFAASIAILAVAIKEIVEAVNLINDIDEDEFKTSAKVLGEVLTIFATVLSDGSGLFGIANAASLLILANAISELTPALEMLVKLNAAKVKTVLNIIGDAFKKFAEAIEAVPFWGAISRSAGIYVLVKAVKELGDGIEYFMQENFNAGNFRNVMSAIGDGFVKFGEALQAAPFWGSKSRAEGISILVSSLKDLGNGIRYFVSDLFDPDKFKTAMNLIADGFTQFGTALYNAPFWGVKSRAEGVSTLVSSIKSLGDGIKPFMDQSFDANKFSAVMDTIGNSFSTFGKALKDSPFLFADKRAEGIGTLIQNLDGLYTGIQPYMTDFDAVQFEKVIVPIGDAFKTFATALKGTPWFNADERSSGIAILIDHIKSLADGITYFQDSIQDKNDFYSAVSVIKKAFVEFGDALKGSPWFKANDRASGIGVLIDHLASLHDGIALFVAGSDYDAFNEVLDHVSTAFVKFGQTLYNTPWFKTKERADSIGVLVTNVSSLAEGLKAFSDTGILPSVISNLLDTIGESLKNFAKAIKDAPLFNSTERAEALVSTINAISNIAPPLTALAEVPTNKLKTVFELLATGENPFLSMIAASVRSYSGMDDAVSSFSKVVDVLYRVKDLTGIATAINEMNGFLDFSERLGDTNTSTLNTFASALENLATNGVRRFISVFQNGTTSLRKAITLFINSAITAIKDTLYLFTDMGTLSAQSFLNAIRANKFNNAADVTIAMCHTLMDAVPLAEFENAGKHVASAIINGFQSKNDDFMNAGLSVSENALQGLRSLNDVFTASGLSISENILQGLTSLNDSFTAAGASISGNALLGLRSVAVVDGFTATGENAALGFVNGLRSKINDAAKAAAELAKTAQNSVNKTLSIHSPSRELFKSGVYSGEGLCLGILSTIPDVTKSGEKVADGALDAVNMAIEKVYDSIDSGFDLSINPVITPVVDLSNVTASANQANEMFKHAVADISNKAYSASVSLDKPSDDSDDSKSETGNSFVFNQYNTSPKALSRLDIYRQTNNQFAAMKAMVNG